ncbi:MAG: hypothetical protein HYU66_23645 [Armatimonadetes bacterium]|nr:hypothetical protein [Armatimonadota bacterium]
MRLRHTFGATDNLVVELRCGDHLQGDAWQQADPPSFALRVTGTAELARIDLVRDYEFVYTVDPDGAAWQATWQDNRYEPGKHLYYLRVQQADQSIAWSSPVWIERG